MRRTDSELRAIRTGNRSFWGHLRYVSTILLAPQGENYEILNYAFLSSAIGVNRTYCVSTTRLGRKFSETNFYDSVKIHFQSQNRCKTSCKGFGRFLHKTDQLPNTFAFI